jgi:hypothetical protein
VVITRTHPLNPATEITVMTPTLSNPTTTSPVLATLFPNLAELLAIDTASNIAAEHQLPRQDGIKLQTEALDRARRTEAGSLLWDSDSATYYIAIPSLIAPSGAETTPNALPLEITPGQSIRMLNLSSEPILTLDLTNNTLNLQTRYITALSSSLYTLDILVSALMTLLLHLHRHTAILAPPSIPAPRFDPPPRSARNSPRTGTLRVFPSTKPKTAKTPSRWLSLRSRTSTPTQTLVPPTPLPMVHLANSPTPSTLFEKDLEAALPPSMSTPIPVTGVAPELRGSNTGVDLSRFQAFDLEDPELSRGTKVMLRLLYWAFGVLVWVLGVGVGCLAAMIVALGGCFGGGKGSREG